MNTLDDLRARLEREAAFDDTERIVRPTAVRARIRTARRRRAGAVAIAAAVVLVVATGTTALVRGSVDPEPAGPTLGDVQVPQRVEVYGFPYQLTDTKPAARDGSLGLDDPAEGETPVVSLAAVGLGKGEATLWSGYYAVARVRGGGDQVSAPVNGVDLSELRIELDGTPASARAEVAVYAPTGELPPGEASDGVVFRQRFGDRQLVAAAFGAADGDARADLPDATDDLEVSAYCHSATPGLWLHREGTTGGVLCSDLEGGNDPGAANADYLLGPQPGEHTFGVYVTKGEDGPRATGVDVAFGFGIYRQAVAPTRVLGEDVLTVLEYNGRTWRLDDVVDTRGDRTVDVDTSHGDVFVGLAYVGLTDLSVSWAGAPEGGWGGFRDNDQPQYPGATYPGVLFTGDRTVRLDATGSHPQVRLLVYRPE